MGGKRRPVGSVVRLSLGAANMEDGPEIRIEDGKLRRGHTPAAVPAVVGAFPLTLREVLGWGWCRGEPWAQGSFLL